MQSWESRPDDPRYGRILHHASAAFLTYGYEKASLESIAIAAGVGKPTVYEFFGSKSGLFERVLDEAVHTIARHLSGPLDPEAPIEETLAAFGRRYMEALYHPMADSPPFHQISRLVIGTSIHDSVYSRRFLATFNHYCYPTMTDYLSALVRAGRIPPVDVEEAARFFFEIAFATYQILFDNSVMSREEISRSIKQRVHRFMLVLPTFVPDPPD